MTPEQLDDLTMMVIEGGHPGVEQILSDYEAHCCEDDALAGRNTDHCEEE